MKTIELRVNLKFTDKVKSDEELQEVVDKVLASLVHTVNTSADGLAPEASETYTVTIDVTEKFSGSSAKHNFLGELNKDLED